MGTCAFDTSGAMEAIGFGMTIALAFVALWKGFFFGLGGSNLTFV